MSFARKEGGQPWLGLLEQKVVWFCRGTRFYWNGAMVITFIHCNRYSYGWKEKKVRNFCRGDRCDNDTLEFVLWFLVENVKLRVSWNYFFENLHYMIHDNRSNLYYLNLAVIREIFWKNLCKTYENWKYNLLQLFWKSNILLINKK